MQTTLAEFLRNTPEGEEAKSIVGKCVHCGFCTATCPTYQLLGDELDGPRGRIYLIKQVLEGHPPTASSRSLRQLSCSRGAAAIICTRSLASSLTRRALAP